MKRHEVGLRAFPRAWRQRYGAELLELLADQPARPWAQSLDLIRAGLHERARGLDRTTVRRAAAVLPAALAAVAIVPAALAPGSGSGPVVRHVTRRHTAPLVVRPKRLLSSPLRAASPAPVPARLLGRHAPIHSEHLRLVRAVPAAPRPRR